MLAPRHRMRAVFPIRSSNCRSRSAAANMRRSPGPISPAGAMTIISRPTRRFAPAAGRSPRSNGCPADPKALGISLRDPCRAAKGRRSLRWRQGKGLFRRAFLPVADLAARRGRGFRHRLLRTDHRRIADADRRLHRAGLSPPSNLFVRGFKQSSIGLPNKGQVFRKIGRRKLVPYYDRAEIEDGAIAGRGLEICWLKDPDRSAVRADPGLGAGSARGRLDHPHQLRCA